MLKTIVKKNGVTVIPEGIKITGFKIHTEEASEMGTEITEDEILLEEVDEKLVRPFKLRGNTYKIKPPNESSSLYLTINDIAMNKDTDHEQFYPYEIFLNSKNMENFQWITTVTRTVSAIFRKGGNITFIVKELEMITQPDGGYWGKDHYANKGKFYESIVAEIGYILRKHMEELGLIKPLFPIQDKQIDEEKKDIDQNVEDNNIDIPDGFYFMENLTCPDCKGRHFALKDGCPTCICGWSKCG